MLRPLDLQPDHVVLHDDKFPQDALHFLHCDAVHPRSHPKLRTLDQEDSAGTETHHSIRDTEPPQA